MERSLDKPFRDLRVIQLCMLAAVPLYFISGRLLHDFTLPQWLFYVPFVFLLFDLARAPWSFRGLQAARGRLSHEPSDPEALGRYRLYTIRFLVTGETLGVAGWVIQVSKEPQAMYWACYGAAILVMLAVTPRRLSS